MTTPVDRTPPPYTLAGWRRLHVVARRLILMRLVRSIAQGALAVDFVLYLKALHWGVASIGSLVAAGGLVGALLILLTGPVSDRTGRRPFLIVYEMISLIGTLLLMLFPQTWVLATVAVVLGFGRGANGTAGPFGPVEQAWLAQHSERSESGRIFSLNGTAGFLGMGVGAALAGLVPLWEHWLPGASAYMPLFGLTAAGSLINLWQVLTIQEVRGSGSPAARGGDRSRSREQGQGQGRPAGAGPALTEAEVRRRENKHLLLLTLINSVNSVAIGLISPMLPYWFAVRFGASPAELGSLYSLTFILTGISSVVTGEATKKFGLVKSVVWVRLVGVLTLLVMPLMPYYSWAAGLYTLRSILNRGSAGARQAFGIGLVRQERRGLASSLTALSFRLPSAVGPAATGWMMSLGFVNLPIFLGAGFGLAYALLFGAIFSKVEAAISQEG